MIVERDYVKTQKYPQDEESNEYRYFSAEWLNEIAVGLTKGATKHPGETWRQIPAREHCWRAVRHLVLWICGDRSEPHIVNASMRCMMAYEVSKKDGQDVCSRNERSTSK